MTPEEYRAWRKAYDAKRYVSKIKPERVAKRKAAEQRKATTTNTKEATP